MASQEKVKVGSMGSQEKTRFRFPERFHNFACGDHEEGSCPACKCGNQRCPLAYSFDVHSAGVMGALALCGMAELRGKTQHRFDKRTAIASHCDVD